MATIETLTAKLNLDIGNWTSNLTKAQKSLGAIGVTSVLVGNLLTKLSETALSVGKDLVKFPIEATKAAGRYADSMDALSAQTGIATQALQGYGTILRRVGVETHGLGISMRTLAMRLQDVRQGSIEGTRTFQELGLSLTGRESPAEVFNMVADALGRMPASFTRSALASELFGRQAQGMLQAINEGPGAFRRAALEAERMGLVLSGTTQKALLGADDAFDNLTSAMQGFTIQVGVAFAPAITLLTNLLVEATIIATDFFRVISGEADKKLLEDINKLSKDFLALQKQRVELAEKIRAGVDIEEAKQTRLGKETVERTQLAIVLMEKMGTSFEIAFDLAAKGYRLAGAEQLKFIENTVAAGNAQKALGEFLLQQQQRQPLPVTNVPGPPSQQQIIGEEAVKQAQAAHEGLLNVQRMEAAETLRRLEIQDRLGISIEQQLANEKEAALLQEELNESYRTRFEILESNASVYDTLFKSEETYAAVTRQTTAKVDSLRFHATEAQLVRQALETAKLQEQYDLRVITAREFQDRLFALEEQGVNDRLRIVERFPSFWEKQLQDIVSANVFSMGLIISTWTSGLARAIVQWQDFNSVLQQLWQQTATTLLQSLLNFLVQWLAELALAALREQAIWVALNAFKTTLLGQEAAAKTAAAIAGTKIEAASAGSTVAAMSAVGAAALGMATAVVTLTVAFYEALAVAAAASVYGAPAAPGFAAAGAAIAAAGVTAIAAAAAGMTAATSAAGGAIAGLGAFAEGGLVTRPMIGLFGEAGPELVIPLNKVGSMLGGEQTIIVELDGRVLMKHTARRLPATLRLKGLPA